MEPVVDRSCDAILRVQGVMAYNAPGGAFDVTGSMVYTVNNQPQIRHSIHILNLAAQA